MRSVIYQMLSVAAMSALVAVGASSANAQSVTFAQFAQSNPGAALFSFDSATRLLTAENAPVRFTFGVDTNAVNAGQQIDALLDFSAVLAPGTPGINTAFTTVANSVSFSFTAITPINGQNNLLSLSNSTSAFTGDGSSANMSGSTNGNPMDMVNFSSAFLNFGPTSERSFAFSFSGVNPPFTTGFAANPQNFTASATGTFSSTPAPIPAAVPEANAGLLMGLAIPMIGGVAVLKRRKK